ncbi:MAG: hypothetical protein CM1200mP37_7960 [Chloroflexota bacterium]|nr:MAG: hypothetical protein CM1200mP37_7960 [Chloroflexota bacterium]
MQINLSIIFFKAAEEKPDLIVAPEGVLEGYVTGEVVENFLS